MAFKDTWKDLQDAVQGIPDSGDDASAETINDIAHAVIDLEDNVNRKEDVSNKVTEISKNATDEQYPSAKAVYDEIYTGEIKGQVDSAVMQANDAYVYAQTLDDEKEDKSNKVEKLLDEESYGEAYPTADAVMFYVQNKDIAVGERISKIEYEKLPEKENISNKVTEISSSSTDEQYPSAKAVTDYVERTLDDYSAYSDERYLLQKGREKSGKSISITGAVPGLDVINYSIWGKCVQETQPTKENPQEVLCVGDLVTDSSDINYGKYKISYTYNAEEYALYLEEPLRGIVSYGYGGNSSNYRYILDYIDFKSQKVIRNVKEEVITDISSIPEQGNIIYITAGLSDFYVRTVKGYSDMTTEHPGGVSNIGDVMSNCVQRVVRSGGSYVQSDSYVMAVDGYNNIYYYWDLNVLGFRVEEGTESDYLLKTSGASPAYYNVYDGETKLTAFAQIRSKIGEIYDGEDFKIYYPLKSASEESIETAEITVPAGGEVTLTVNTQTEPEKVSIEYYADITVTIKELEEKIEELTKAILSNGGNI